MYYELQVWCGHTIPTHEKKYIPAGNIRNINTGPPKTTTVGGQSSNQPYHVGHTYDGEDI